MPAIIEMVQGVRQMGMETCMTLGMLAPHQARQMLADAGLDYYNHNIDTSPEKLRRGHHHAHLRRTGSTRWKMSGEAGINVCCGGIVGMGETRADRVGFVHALATLPRHPESVPVNALVPVQAAPCSAICSPTRRSPRSTTSSSSGRSRSRAITMPLSMVRLSAGRESMSEATQALCFMAGANSIFTGDKLLTTGNAWRQTSRRRAVWRSSDWCRGLAKNRCGRRRRAADRTAGCRRCAGRTSGDDEPHRGFQLRADQCRDDRAMAAGPTPI